MHEQKVTALQHELPFFYFQHKFFPPNSSNRHLHWHRHFPYQCPHYRSVLSTVHFHAFPEIMAKTLRKKKQQIIKTIIQTSQWSHSLEQHCFRATENTGTMTLHALNARPHINLISQIWSRYFILRLNTSRSFNWRLWVDTAQFAPLRISKKSTSKVCSVSNCNLDYYSRQSISCSVWTMLFHKIL